MQVLLLVLVLEPLLAANGQHVVVERNLDVVLRHAREFGCDPDDRCGLRNVQVRGTKPVPALS